MPTVASLTARIGADIGGLDAGLRVAEGKVRSFADRLNSAGTRLSVGLTAPLVALATASVRSATQMDSLKRGLTAVAGSAAEADRQLARLREIAKLPGLGRVEAIEASTQLQAAGLSAKTAERSLLAFGNALATVGKGKAELRGVTLALAQITAKGKVTAEEINQIAERVPQIRVAMQAAFGTANTELLQKMGLTARQFIEGINQELLKLPRVTGGAQTAFENLSDVVGEALSEIGANILPTLLPIVERLTNSLVNLTKQFAALSPEVRRNILVVAGLVALAGPTLLFLGQFAGALKALGVTIPTLTMALRGVVAFLGGPWGIALAAAAAVVVTNWDTIKTTISDWAAWVVPTLQETWANIVSDATPMLETLKQTVTSTFADIQSSIETAAAAWTPSLERAGSAIGRWIAKIPEPIRRALGIKPAREFIDKAVERFMLGSQEYDAIFGDMSRESLQMAPIAAGGDFTFTPAAKKPKKTPLQQDMEALQQRLNAAWLTGAALAKDYSEEVAGLFGQFRAAAQTFEGRNLIEKVFGAEQGIQKIIEARNATKQWNAELERVAAERAGLLGDPLPGLRLRFPGRTDEELKALDIRQKGNERLSEQQSLIQRLNQEGQDYFRQIKELQGINSVYALSVVRTGTAYEHLDKETRKAVDGLWSWISASRIAQKENARQQETLRALQSMAEATKNVFVQAFEGIQNGFSGLFRSIIDGVRQMLVQIAAEYLAAQATNAILGVIGGAIGLKFPKVGSVLGSATRRQAGGPVNAGRSYLVGERGPELFVPSRSGRILANGAMAGAGGQTVVVNMTVNTPDAMSFQRNRGAMMADLRAEIERASRRNG